jgi:hypothetical protein
MIRLNNPIHRVRGVGGSTIIDACYPGESERAADLERRNRELNDRRVAMGRITREQAAAQEARFNADDPSTWDREIAQAFLEGAGDGLSCFPDTFRNALNTAAGWSLRFVPWWVWVAAGVAVLQYLGVFDGLKGSLSTRRK